MYEKNEDASPPPSRSDGMPAKSGRTFRAHLDSCRMKVEPEDSAPMSPAKEMADKLRMKEKGKY